jgi:hypothetical protein
MKEYEQTVSEEDAYEAQYKTGCETPVRTNSGERKPTNLVAFFSLYTVFHPDFLLFSAQFFSKLGTSYPQFGVLYG